MDESAPDIDKLADKHPADAMDYRAMYELVVELTNTVMDQALKLREEKEQLELRVQSRTDQLEQANLDAMYMLATAAEARDVETGEHVRRVEWLTYRLATELGYGDGFAREIGRASVLHDVGKLHVPEQILLKPGPLTDAERVVMNRHTVVGEQIISERPYFAMARRIARQHHENIDGSGYPDGLRLAEISPEARIVRVADTFDALTNLRPYKRAWPVADAVNYIESNRGLLFDEPVVAALLRIHAARQLQRSLAADETWMI